MRPRRGPASPVFEIWQVEGRVTSIDNPVRLAILHSLEGKPATLGGLVKVTGKAKSTLSKLHIRPLVQTGIVAEAIDPNDARVKWYTLRGSRLGSSAVAASQLRDAVLGYVQGAGLLPLRPLLDVVQVPDLVAGPRTYSDGVAQRLGTVLGRMLTATTRPARVAELDAILQREGLGRAQGKGPDVTANAPGAQAFLEILVDAALAAPRPRA